MTLSEFKQQVVFTICIVILLIHTTKANQQHAANTEEMSNVNQIVNSNGNSHKYKPELESLRSLDSYEFDPDDSDEKPRKKKHRNVITDINEKSFQDKLKSNDRFQGVLEKGGAMLVEKFRPWEHPRVLRFRTPAHPVVTRSPYAYP